MNAKKGLFGYRNGLGRFVSRSVSDWFDASVFLVSTQEVLPEEEEEKPSFPLGKALLVIAAGVLMFRLTNLQIAEGSEHRFLAEGNRVRRQITVAPRGTIVDRRGTPLVSNQPGYSLEIVPSDLPRKQAARDAIIQQLASTIQLSEDEVRKTIEAAGLSSLDPVTIQPNLAREQAILYKVKFAALQGVRVTYVPSRRYDSVVGLSHLIGYTSRMTEADIERHLDYHRSSPIGRTGLESSYDVYLRGEEGASEVEVNANGQFQRSLHTIPPKVGKTLHLTLDYGLQAAMAAALQEAMQKNGAKQGAGVAMDPRTGGILASVSLPSYDNNLFAKGISQDEYQKISTNPDKPLLNRVVDGVYPAGSTIKPFVAAAALQEGTISPNTRLDTSIGVIKIGQWEFPDWKVHGVTDVKLAIAESNDIFFYALGGGYEKIPGLGVERLKKYFNMFGFGQDTGVDYATEQSGLVPDPAWKERVKKESWYIGDTYHISIGQGDLLSTPLQLVRGLSSLINGGRLLTPHLVEALGEADSNEKEPLTFPERKIDISPEVIKVVQEGMRLTVNSDTGSARTLRALPFTSAGKTGTAQFGSEEKTHAWYIGYAPYENPEIAVAIIVEGGGEGNAISVPAAEAVFRHYMSHR